MSTEKRLRSVARIIQKNPIKFEMLHHLPGGKSLVEAAIYLRDYPGTVGDIAGWTLVAHIDEIRETDTSVILTATRILSLSDTLAESLFYIRQWPTPRQIEYNRAVHRGDDDGAAAAATARIEDLIKLI